MYTLVLLTLVCGLLTSFLFSFYYFATMQGKKLLVTFTVWVILMILSYLIV
jgi:hypothetical protein